MRHRQLLLVTLVASAAVAACAPPPPPAPDTAAVRTAIDAANAAFVAAAEKGDAAQMTAGYDANAIALGPGGPAASGSAEIAKMMGGMLDAVAIKEFSLTTSDLIVTGDYAIETGTYAMVVTPKKGKDTPDNGKYVVVWKKQADGSWKMLRDIWNTNVAPKA